VIRLNVPYNPGKHLKGSEDGKVGMKYFKIPVNFIEISYLVL